MLEIMRYELVSAHPDSVEHLQRVELAWCCLCCYEVPAGLAS